MTSLDAELALFEQEINSLTSEPPASTPAPAPPPPQPSSSKTANSSSGSFFVPHQIRAPPMSLPPQPPLPPRPPLPPNAFPQAATHNATIESEPSLYKAEPVPPPPAPESPPRLAALPSDIEAIARKRDVIRRESMINKQTGKRFVRTAGGQVWEDPSLAEWDPNDFRIFCGDLGNEVSDELLAKAFRKYPSFLKAKVCRDGRTNKSKGFGFVSFKSQEDYVRAIREMDGKYVGNRPIKLRKSQWKDRNIDVVQKKVKQKKKLGLMY